MMFIAFAALGDARTTRQGRGTAAAAAVAGVAALRVAAFAASSVTVRTPLGLIWVYGLPLIVIAGCLAMIFQGPRAKALGARFARWASAAVVPRLPLPGRA